MRTGETVRAPVDGTVVAVQHYALYGTTRDVRVVLRPDADPGLRVLTVHVDDVAVAEGDTVTAGQTVLGSARTLPFASQVDSHTGQRLPHVHLEVRRAGAVDPDVPASPPDPPVHPPVEAPAREPTDPAAAVLP